MTIATTASEHSLLSSYRESLLEHLFTSAVMSHLWLNGFRRVEVLKPQVDNSGYDLVLEASSIVRHVQLKASHQGAATSAVNIHTALEKKPSGCVIWMRFDSTTLEISPYYWFGAGPGQSLPSLEQYPVAKHAKANAQGIKTLRPEIRRVPVSQFDPLLSIADVVEALFESPVESSRRDKARTSAMKLSSNAIQDGSFGPEVATP